MIVILVTFFAALPIQSPPTPQDQAPPNKTGAELYVEFCAACHGRTGDGKGEMKLERPARSFQDGGFAFGNTDEALFKTITTGIPGTKMAGFKTKMSEPERRRVVEHLRTLLPPTEVATPKETVMATDARPILARGLLPPISKGTGRQPRGLLIGYPEGLTFEYRIDDVRLLGVRQGSFADRHDWHGRGGGILNPLGRVIYLFAGGRPNPVFLQRGEPLRARCTKTWTDASQAGLEYRLESDGLAGPILVRESHRIEGLSQGSGFTRFFDFEPPSSHDVTWVLDEGPKNSKLIFGHSLDENRRLGAEHWLVRQDEEARYTLIRLRGFDGQELIADPARVLVHLRLAKSLPRTFTVTTIQSAEWSEALLQELAEELKP